MGHRVFRVHDLLRVLADHQYPRELVVYDEDFQVIKDRLGPSAVCLHRAGVMFLSTLIIPRSSWAPICAGPHLIDRYTEEDA